MTFEKGQNYDREDLCFYEVVPGNGASGLLTN